MGVHAAIVRIEVKAQRVVRADGAERPRPIVASEAGGIVLIVGAVASGRQEYGLSVLFRGEEAALLAITRRPLVSGVVFQLLPLRLAWCAPAAAPVGRGGVIAALQGSQVVGEAVVAVVAFVAVFSQK